MISSLLTKKQERFYQVLKSYIERNGEAPTVQELMKLLGMKSPRAVTQYLDTLERKGLVSRLRYEVRGIRLKGAAGGVSTVTIPVLASAGCDNVSVLAERVFDEYMCIASDLLRGRKKDKVVGIRAVGDSMVDAGVRDNDYVLVEMTEAVSEGDLVVAIIDGFAVVKKLELANNALILRPVSSDPQFKPIIVRKNFKIFGKVIDVIRAPQKGDLEVVPLVSQY